MPNSDPGAFVEFERAEIEQTIHSRFEKQAALYPDRIAVQSGECRLTYRELNRRANQVSHAIRAVDDRAQEPVALLIEQGAPLLAAILGVLKAGKIYIPIDSRAPADAIRRVLGHSGAALILSSRDTHRLAADLCGGRTIVCIDSIDDFKAGDVSCAVGYDALACIYYTSGSTGVPKGVVDCHRHVLHNIMRYTNSLRITRNDRLSLLQAPHFSGAVSSMFCALLTGGTLFPFDPRGKSVSALSDWASGNGLTIWHSVPSLFRQLCAEVGPLPPLRIIRLEGDQSTPADVALYRRHFGSTATLVNGLGATETGITRQFFIGPDTDLGGDWVPIGYAVRDMEVTVVEQTGEIEVKSRYLAVGYWKEPELTAHAFRGCPDDPEVRIFRTGDLGRLRADGCLVHLGRRDSRLKVRGEWVDLADVEAALRALPGVDQAAVAASADRHGETRLVGYIVPARRPGPASRQLRRGLSARLASHQIPAIFVALDALPLTDNGKLDRRALPAPGTKRPELDHPATPPRTDAEMRMAAHWRGALGLDDVGIDDDFFELGGDSLTLARLSSRTGIDIDAFLRAPTIRRLVAERNENHGSDLLVPLRQGRDQRSLFCFPGHDGSLVGFAVLARYLDSGSAVWGLRTPPVRADYTPLQLRDLARHYLDLVRSVQPEGPYLLAGHCFGGYVAYEMACQLASDGDPVALLTLLECSLDGWVRQLRARQRLSLQLGHLRRRTGYHVRRLIGRGPDAGLAYAKQRLKKVVEVRQEMMGQAAFDCSLRRAALLSPELCRPQYANRNSVRDWVPEPYAGRTLIIDIAEPRAGEYPARLRGWEGLLTGVVEVAEVSDGLRGLLAEPAVDVVASHFNLAMASNQSLVPARPGLAGMDREAGVR